MSQLFRVLKKIPKNSQHQTLDKGESSTKEKDVTKMESIYRVQVENTAEDTGSLDTTTDDAEEDVMFSKSVQDLRKFCDQLDDFVEKSQKILDKAYESDVHSILQKRLRKGVTDLMNVQKQIKTVLDNIRAVKMQIAAVKLNLEEHKNKFNTLKADERRTRFFLAHETNKRDKNIRNQEKSTIKERDNSLPKFYIAPTGNETSRPVASTSNTVRTTFFSIPAINDNENSSSSNNTTSRSSRNPSRPLATAVKRVKAVRQKKESLLPVPQTDQNGVTIVLHPINEQEKYESPNRPQSHHSTPSTSIVNFSWFNNLPDQTHSDTATNSTVSASNSLFVFSSSGRFEDLD